ncbi:putative Mg2+ chelatase family protein [Deinococcus grandis]|uniref:Putative Mg2+ chelatase family protein n=1 Tax=Deinococcus grandis TaxID=57498 RepID=A0A100HGY3_9DEIO|nr:hypothetical protein DEGR_27660 [Deinococcus grandis]GAQ20485.1 putative Mg2+ chelatase family protein [Deinococcus grandis]
MLVRVQSTALFGVDAGTMEIQVDVSPGLPAFTIPGSVHQIIRRRDVDKEKRPHPSAGKGGGIRFS